MHPTPTLIANLPKAGLASFTGGFDWVVSAACWAAAALVGAVFPGLGGLLTLSCYIPV